MSEGILHIRDVEGPKKTGSMETKLEAMEQQVFKWQGMVERGLNANHMMITEFTSNHKMDAIDIGKHLSRLYHRVDQLQGQIYDLQNQTVMEFCLHDPLETFLVQQDGCDVVLHLLDGADEKSHLVLSGPQLWSWSCSSCLCMCCCLSLNMSCR
ncbi:40S ribosomal protein S5-1 [Hordeum vulgare]|nr:40S ribosomal protein S5-1 [Hordeum vulgare]